MESKKLYEDLAGHLDQAIVGAPGCAAEAIDLVLRAEVKPPPDLAEFLTARYKEI